VSSGSPEPLATHKSKPGKTDDRIVDDVHECRGFTGRDARRLYMIGAILFPAGVAVVPLKGKHLWQPRSADR